MRVVVTGASGFIGRHVLRELDQRQIEIVAVTRHASRLVGAARLMKVIEVDIYKATPLQLQTLADTDVLLHLAWDGLPNYKSLHHFEAELPRQYEFLKSLVQFGLPAMLVAGTCFEYGLQSGELLEETHAAPVVSYGFAKDSLRKQLEFLRADQSFSMVWARLFYSYGNGQARNSLFPQLVAAVNRGDLQFDMSGGEQLRDYLPVEDVARLLVDLATCREHLGIVNVCSGQPISVGRLVNNWLEQNGWRIHLNRGRYPYPDFEPLAFWGSRLKLNKILGKENA